jgi:hypothetical protein
MKIRGGDHYYDDQSEHQRCNFEHEGLIPFVFDPARLLDHTTCRADVTGNTFMSFGFARLLETEDTNNKRCSERGGRERSGALCDQW